MVDLDNNVDEVKKQIRNAEDPDYEELLRQEEEGNNRKTVVEFLEKKIGEEVEEEMSKDEETQEEVEEELVEEIEDETEGGVLSGFTDPQILAGGAIVGLVLGLVFGAVASGAGVLPAESQDQITSVQAEERISTLLTAGQTSEEDLEISTEERNGMFFHNVTITTTVNETERSQSRAFYMSPDGQKLFRDSIRSPLGGSQRVTIDVERALNSIENRAEQPTQPETNTSTNTTQ